MEKLLPPRVPHDPRTLVLPPYLRDRARVGDPIGASMVVGTEDLERLRLYHRLMQGPLGWHFTNAEGTLRNGDGRQVRLGEPLNVPFASLRYRGLHLSRDLHVAASFGAGPRLWLVALAGPAEVCRRHHNLAAGHERVALADAGNVSDLLLEGAWWLVRAAVRVAENDSPSPLSRELLRAVDKRTLPNPLRRALHQAAQVHRAWLGVQQVVMAAFDGGTPANAADVFSCVHDAARRLFGLFEDDTRQFSELEAFLLPRVLLRLTYLD